MSTRSVTDAMREIKKTGWICWKRFFFKRGGVYYKSHRSIWINWKEFRKAILKDRSIRRSERMAKVRQQNTPAPVLPPQPPSACKLCGEGMVPEGLDAVEYYACSDCGWTWPEEKDSDNPLAPTPPVL